MTHMSHEELDAFVKDTKKDTEPAVRIGVVVGIITSIAFGILYSVTNLTSTQLLTSTIVLCLILPIFSAFIIRNKVWATPTVKRYVWHKIYSPPQTRPVRLTPVQLNIEEKREVL